MLRNVIVLAISLCALLASTVASVDPRVAYLEPVVDTEGTYYLGLKTLVIASDTKRAKSALSILNSLGSPYDLVTATPVFTDPKYNVIVLTDEVSGVDLVKINAYAIKYKVRVVKLQIKAFEQYGLTTSTTNVNNMNIVMDDAPIMDYYSDVMNTKGAWDASKIDPIGAEIMPDLDTRIDRVIPMMRYTAGSTTVANGPIAAYITNYKDGLEVMCFTFDATKVDLDSELRAEESLADKYSFFNLALANMWFTWASRGVFMGKRRISLQMQIDDWFLASDSYGETTPFRLSGKDVEHAIAWINQIKITANLPEGSNVTFEPAFNGAGIAMVDFEDNGLVSTSKHYAGRFNWVSHTWTHQNMDWLETFDCNGQANECHPDEARYIHEFQYNIDVVEDRVVGSPSYAAPWEDFGNATPAMSLFNNNDEREERWSRHSLVTPEISGLWPDWFPIPRAYTEYRKPNPKNELLFKMLDKFEIRAVVGDNTREELTSKNPFHGVLSTVDAYGSDNVIIIPRMAPNVDYNINNLEQFADYYNTEGVCGWVVYGPSCKRTPYTGLEALEREAFSVLLNFIQYRQDAYMFHQSNMHAQLFRQDNMPIVGIWAQFVLEGVMEFINELPVLSPKMDVTAEEYRKRMARDACGLQGFVKIVNGTPQGITVGTTNNNTCEAVVTMVGKEHPLLSLDPSSYAQLSKEEYGNDTTLAFAITPEKNIVELNLLSTVETPTVSTPTVSDAAVLPEVPAENINGLENGVRSGENEAPTTGKTVGSESNEYVNDDGIERSKADAISNIGADEFTFNGASSSTSSFSVATVIVAFVSLFAMMW
ncbi:hypothetical protein, variant [Sphaeroforma arctica JP610]|uniref:Agd3 deacetylase domain-containing protein n=1 Tax=Sphaeroforma arctica JP610 TaxID=667725 RepID=A0A0L0G8U5_9EUKA|nr:hypothetical protein, variant [Sphaeroforma arctica JP610]KNC85425.1 hypothetical protein, variant [Sphaeroforma arctica JP610]|eukprot:XP_014159327.1 hypothetical protein, variant [Sphaeroforma arctica JP610]